MHMEKFIQKFLAKPFRIGGSKQIRNRQKQEAASVFSEVNQETGSDGASPSQFLAWSRAFCITLGSSSSVNKGVNIFF